MDRDEGRSARKRRAILDAATELFLRNGYQGTSMDEVAALAAVSKQTVYKNFADKEKLFTEIVLRTLDGAGPAVRARLDRLRSTDDLAAELRDLGRAYLTAAMRPAALRLRRLVIGAANRLPELAETYYRRAPEPTVTALADCFAHLADRGLLRAVDPEIAAHHFAVLVLGRAVDRALFFGDEHTGSPAELAAVADAGADAFLAAYARQPSAALT